MRRRQMKFGIALIPLFIGCGAPEEDIEVGVTGAPVTITDRTYELRSVNSGRCAVVNGASQVAGAEVVQRDCSGSAARSWQVRRLSGDLFEIKTLHSNQCLTVDGNSSQDGRAIEQAPCTGAANQKWLLVEASGALLLKPQVSGANNKKCMDVTASSQDSGAAVVQWTCHGLPNQLWTFNPTGSGTGGGDSGGDGSTPMPSGVTVSYSIDSTSIFANPERGFYHHQEAGGSSYSPLSQSTLTAYRTSEAVSLILRLFYLDAFRNGSISASYLDSMRTDFSRIRAAGIKAVLRFAYTSSMSEPYGDASRTRVLGHIAQLKPVLQANADVIATVQVGFVGAWGEWYYTDYGVSS